MSFNANPVQYLIQECDMKSREKRRALENGIGLDYLTPMNVSIERLVNEYIRENESENVLKEVIRNKFKGNAPLVDLRARYVFKNPTVSILKSSYGFNQHASRDQKTKRIL